MRGIITVLGHDRVGIIAEVCAYLSAKRINILDISQTIVQGFFNMLMIVDLPAGTDFERTVKELRSLGGAMGLEIKLQREDIFEAMYRV